MDAHGHLGGAEEREVEDGDPDAHGSGQGTPAHLVDADDGVEPLGSQGAFDAEIVQSTCGHQLTVIPCGAGTFAKTSFGLPIQRMWLRGQLTKKTVPTTFSAGTNG